jgi:hypothetical protein
MKLNRLVSTIALGLACVNLCLCAGFDINGSVRVCKDDVCIDIPLPQRVPAVDSGKVAKPVQN